MDDQGFLSGDTTQTDLNTDSQIDSLTTPTSMRWHTTNSSNTREIELHLSQSSVTRDVRAIINSNESWEDSEKPDLPAMSKQTEYQLGENNSSSMSSDRYEESHEQAAFLAAAPGYSPDYILSDNDYHSNQEEDIGLNEKSQSIDASLKTSSEPTSVESSARRGSDHRSGSSEQEEPTNRVAAAKSNQEHRHLRTDGSTDRHRGSKERLDPTHPVSTSEIERRGRSPSPRPKISAETKARWAMLKQLAGVSQPHDVGEEIESERLDANTTTTGTNTRIREEARGGDVREPWQTDDRANDASIERYLQRLQGDPHIDDRGLREGLSRMHSYKGSNRLNDRDLAHENHVGDDTLSGARILDDNTYFSEVEKVVPRERQYMGTLPEDKRRAELAFRGREAALRKDKHALEAGLESASHKSEGKLLTGSRDARGHLQKFIQSSERDVRRDTNHADAEMHNFISRTSQEVGRTEHTLVAGLQKAALAVDSSPPHTNIRQDLQRGETKLMEEIRKTEDALSRTGLGLDIQRGEHELIGEVRELKHEFAHIGPGREIRKGKADLMGDIHKVKNELVNTGQEIRKGERHVVHELNELEDDVSQLGLGQDLRRGEHDLKQAMHEAADHLHRDEQAIGTGAEAVGRSLEHGLETIEKFVLEGTETAGGQGAMAYRHAGPRNNASSPRPNLIDAGHAMVKPNDQKVPSKIHHTGAQPSQPPGLSPAIDDRRANHNPASDQNRPSIVEPPHHPPISQMLQSRKSSDSQQPHLPPTSSPAETPSLSSATNKSPRERLQSPSLGDKRMSQTPVRKAVLRPQPQGSSQQRPSTAMAPHPQPQLRHGASQHLSQNQQHPQETLRRPPQHQHPENTQPHPQNATSQQFQPSQPRGTTQHQQYAPFQHPQPRSPRHQHALNAPHSAVNAMHQHPQAPEPQNAPQHQQNATSARHPQTRSSQPQHPMSLPQHAVHAMPQHPEAPRPHGNLQQGQASQETHQPAQPRIAPQQRQPANATPRYSRPPQLQNAPKPISQIRVPLNTTPPQIRVTPRQTASDSTHPRVQALHQQGSPQQGPASSIEHPQPQNSEGVLQMTSSEERREREAQRPAAVHSGNMQQAGHARPGAAAESRPRMFSGSLKSEEKIDKEDSRASLVQESLRGAAESQRRLAGQEHQNKIEEDEGMEYSSYEIETPSTTEHAVEARSISGPQSALNMFKARADAAIKASGECPSFTDREFHSVLMVSFPLC